MSADIFFVNQKKRNSVLEEFNKTPQQFEENVNTLAEWVTTQPHFPEIMDKAVIRNFLILNKLSVEKTKKKIDLYYTIRTVKPNLYKNTNPNSKNMINMMKQGICCVHPTLKKTYRCYFVKPMDPFDFNPTEIIMQMFNILEVRLHEDCVVGDIIIFDLQDVTFDQVKQFTSTLLKKILVIYNVFSIRLKAGYLINSSYFIEWLLNILKMILKPKLFSRIHAYENEEILKTIFTKEELSQDYGGTGSKLTELNVKKLSEFEDRFDKLQNMQTNENLRPQKLSNDEVLGFYGNFQKLSVD